MSDDLVMILLRAIRTDIGEVKADIAQIKERLGMLVSQYSSLSRRIERIGGDAGIMRRRFDNNMGRVTN